MQAGFIVKVCGITTVADAQASLDAGANALGFNFYPGSPRFISAEQAALIADGVRGVYLRVGVFVNASELEVTSAVAKAGLQVVQLHGRMTPISGLRNWRAHPASSRHVSEAEVEAYLLDSFTPNFGGSGQTFDWSLAAGFPSRAIIAGGLDSLNVAEAIRIAQPWGVDSCSRLESHPGRKDHRRVAAFVDAALSAFHSKQQLSI